MELLLNLFWLSLAVNVTAAGWMAGSARISRFGRVLLVGCISLVLFPIVSASDDVRALAIECEDSAICKPNSPKHAKFQGLDGHCDVLAFSGAKADDLIPPPDQSGNEVERFTSHLPMQGSA